MNGKKIMAKLHESVGKPVKIKYTFFGRAREDEGTLKSIRPYERIELEQPSGREGGIPLLTYIPFLDTNHGIQEIAGEDGEILYQNSLIAEGIRSTEEVRKMAIETFGMEIANKFFPEKEIKTARAVRTETVEDVADPAFAGKAESLTE